VVAQRNSAYPADYAERSLEKPHYNPSDVHGPYKPVLNRTVNVRNFVLEPILFLTQKEH